LNFHQYLMMNRKSTSSNLERRYSYEVLQKCVLDLGGLYDFQSNITTSVKAVDADTLYLTTEETFYFYSYMIIYIIKQKDIRLIL